MALAAWFLLAFLAGLLALLAIPLHLSFTLQRHEGRHMGSGTLGWLFGTVQIPIHPRARAKRALPKISTVKRERGGGTRRVVSMLQTKGFGRRALKLARDLLRHTQVQTLDLDIRLGLDDPADTGRLWGVVGPLAALLPLPPVARIAITPDFAAEVLEVEGQGQIRIIPLQWLAVILLFALSPTTLRALRALSL